ncbi:hypothetical protein GGI04_005840 [Coemansia thaxteri]|nr:hypothetical protein GGI04_005840 [Coemansia thaxteri]KAJ2462918.1 hypothetical protein GGI02_005350 [Coemansia sp. RSA 2322]
MVKLLAALLASAALLQCASAHMSVISPPPRSGIIANELIKPCGGGNTLTKNVTTYDANSGALFVLRPGHGTGNLLFNYFTDLTVTNDTKSFPLANVPIPVAGTYNTTLDFAKAGLKNGQSIVVQAIYNGTDSGNTDQYYVCFDVKLASASSTAGPGATHTASDIESDSGLDTQASQAKTTKTSGAVSSVKAALGAFIGLAVAAAVL